MGKQAGFFALYRKLQPLIEAIYDALEAAENCPAATLHNEEDTSELEFSLERINACSADEQLCPLKDDALSRVVAGVNMLTDWLALRPWLKDAESNIQTLKAGIAELQEGSGKIEDFLSRMARRAFGYWGAYFFSWLEDYERCEIITSSLPMNPAEDIPTLLEADDLPDEPVDMPPKYVLSPIQRDILKALDGTALKKEELAKRAFGESDHGNRLYRDGRITKELREFGFVKHDHRIGYWRPDRPPMEHLDILFPGANTKTERDDEPRQQPPSADASKDDLPY